MLTISKENIIEYLKKHMPEFDLSIPVTISEIGDGSEEEDGDGYVNYIFRINTEKEGYVLKQGLPLGKMTQYPMGIYRNRLEYDAMKIYHAIVPEYVPFLKFHDQENNIFVMEDVSRLKVSRFQFNKNVMFEDFGRQCGEFMAKTAFYTSEFFLNREEYRKLQERFENTELRKIMEDGMFLDFFGEPYEEILGEEFKDFAKTVSEDARFRTELYKLRRIYMTHADALVHSDLHTSNILASEDEMKVIDMEFCFMGPFGYDLGYLAGNLISQYCAACFKPFESEHERREFKAYLLSTIKSLYYNFKDTFIRCWNQDAKERYAGQSGLLESVFEEIMLVSPGYAAMVNWFRTASDIAYPDFEVIKDIEDKRHAQTLSLLVDWQLMFGRYGYTDVDDMIETILFVEESYKKAME